MQEKNQYCSRICVKPSDVPSNTKTINWQKSKKLVSDFDGACSKFTNFVDDIREKKQCWEGESEKEKHIRGIERVQEGRDKEDEGKQGVQQGEKQKTDEYSLYVRMMWRYWINMYLNVI